MMSVAELSALVPLTGATVRHAEYFVDPALSFAQGWNSLYSWFVSLPAELTAAAVIVSFWDSTTTAAAWIVLFGALLVIANMLFVRIYGEMEFIFATLKIMLIVGLNIMVCRFPLHTSCHVFVLLRTGRLSNNCVAGPGKLSCMSVPNV